jgi:hypothetical protein
MIHPDDVSWRSHPRIALQNPWTHHLAILGIVWLSWSIHAFAQTNTLGRPTGEVILTISGKISKTNHDSTADFDLAMLNALRHRKTETSTPWTKGKPTFEGPLLTEVLDAVGCTGSQLRVVALNDYTTTVPVEDARKWPVILATHMNGTPMTVRQKGPLFIIYPFDEYPKLYNEMYFFRSAWQVRQIDIR